MPKAETRHTGSKKPTTATSKAASKAQVSADGVRRSAAHNLPRKSKKARAGAFLTPIEAFHATLPDLVAIFREGIPAGNIVLVSDAMHLDQSDVINFLRLSRSTIGRKIRDRQNLTTEQSERLVGLQRLIGQVEAMVQESGDASDFDAGQWFAQWIRQPLGALDGVKPEYYLDTMSGQQLVSQLLAQMQSGAYA